MALEPPLLSPHEVRVSGGIENAFVFLFHLRYQFCLVSEETRQEFAQAVKMPFSGHDWTMISQSIQGLAFPSKYGCSR